ncbi:MAG: ATP-binding protein [Campylobacterota bacterium]|nr:ATP-binding protein [Campylobacterota bacterium]
MTDEEFRQFIETIISELASTTDRSKRLDIVYRAIKNFVPSDSIELLEIDSKSQTAHSMLEDASSAPYAIDDRGVLAQCYESHQPLIINDIERSLLYNSQIDSLGREDIYKVLVVPVLDSDASKNILGVVWVGIERGFKQFIQKDVDQLVQFTNAVASQLFDHDSSDTEKIGSDLEVCRESKRVLQVKMERYEKYFASTVHDIRAPMNAIVGFMELMMLNETDDQKKEYIDASLKSGEHIIALINDALDMSKVSSGKMTLDKRSFSPMAGFGDIAKLFYNSMSKKSIEFNIYIDPLMPTLIKSDLYRIKQIVNNLLSNAMKFTPEEGNVILEVIYNKESDTLKASVTDTGIGVAKDRQKSIFNPYTQEKDSTSSEYGGTGLGLAISQQLSTLLDGTLTLESEQGHGSKFTLTLPCDTPVFSESKINREPFAGISVLIYSSYLEHNASQVAQRYLDNLKISHNHLDSSKPLQIDDSYTVLMIDKRDVPRNIDAVQNFLDSNRSALIIESDLGSDNCHLEGHYKILHRPILPDSFFDTLQALIDPKRERDVIEESPPNYDILKGQTVLAVDDSRINLRLMTEVLKRFQLDVTTSLNGKEALEVFEDKTFSVVFIDQNMPVMNGDEVITKMREIEKTKGQKPAIIYGLTGDADDEIIEKIVASGANEVLTKPIHIEEVYVAISNAINTAS